MLNLEKRIKETMDLSSFCILNVNYCLYIVYGVDNYLMVYTI
jgi:hypothetical protein